MSGQLVEIRPPADTPHEAAGFFKLDITEVVLTYVGTPADTSSSSHGTQHEAGSEVELRLRQRRPVPDQSAGNTDGSGSAPSKGQSMSPRARL
jgi:hypothetical protein